jgi:hypothetical protein
MTREERFQKISKELGYSFDGEIKVGGNYSPLVEHQDAIYISGQIPRVGNDVVIQGALGADVTLEAGQTAAKICVMRAIALLLKHLGSLDRVQKILRIMFSPQQASPSKAKFQMEPLRSYIQSLAMLVFIQEHQLAYFNCRRMPQ